MTVETTISTPTEDSLQQIARVARQLPGAFTSDGVDAIVSDASNHRCLAAVSSGSVVGFIVWSETYCEIELLWMGVMPAHQGQGIGCRLVERVEQTVTTQKIIVLKTADPQYIHSSMSLDPGTFQVTLDFWTNRGYTRIATVSEFWDENSGAILLAKRIRNGR